MKTEKRFVCTIDEEDGEFVTLKMAPVDLVALLKLADEMEQAADRNRLTGMTSIGRARSWADRIREALGASDG